TPSDHMEGPPAPLLRRRLVANQGGYPAVQPGQGTHHAIPLPGCHRDPITLAHHRMTRIERPLTGLVESPVPGQQARRVRRAGQGNGLVERPAPRLGPTLQLHDPQPTGPRIGTGQGNQAQKDQVVSRQALTGAVESFTGTFDDLLALELAIAANREDELAA